MTEKEALSATANTLELATALRARPGGGVETHLADDIPFLVLKKDEQLYDLRGNGFSLELAEKRRWFSRPEYVPVIKKGRGLETSVEKNMYTEVKKGHEAWLTETVIPGLKEIIPDTDKLVNELLAESARAFRKKFTEALSVQGKGILQKMLVDFFQDIGALWTKAEKQDVNKNEVIVEESELLPRNVRLTWHTKNASRAVGLYCLEFPPCVRTISLFGKQRHLAFPWMVMFALFENLNFESFHFFYRPGPITSHKDAIYFSNLPHFRKDWPHHWCLGGTAPPITTMDPDWDTKLMDYFWNSFFIDSGGLLGFYEEYTETIPELKSDGRWEKLSAKEPEKILSLPWIPVGQSIGDFARKLVAKKIAPDEKKTMDKKKAALEEQKKIILQKFSEKLQEELFFLGSSLHFPQDSKKRLVSFFNNRLSVIVETSLSALSLRVQGAGKRVREIFTNTSGEGA